MTKLRTKKSLFFLLLFLLFICCPKLHTAAQSNDFYIGNNSENILNGGVIAYEDGNTYCADQNSANYLYLLKEDNSKTLLSKDSCSYINLSNDWIYYVKNSKEICRITKNGKSKETIYTSKTAISDFYLVNDSDFYFIADGNIHCYSSDKDTVLYQDGSIAHIIPTSYGVIYAKGKLFNWDLYVQEQLIEKEVTSFYEVDNYLYFTKDSELKQADCSKLFTLSTPSKAVENYVDKEKDITLSDTDTIALEEQGELLTAEEKQEEISLLSTETYTSALSTVSQGQQNIVKRAMQQYLIEWTPQKDIKGWGNNYTFKKGVTYSGLPYGQPVNASYVPWNTSLSNFVAYVNNLSSKMYTSTSTYNKVAPYYSTDCSAFVAWAWQLEKRQTTTSLHNFATKVATQSIYSMEIGDALVYAGSHTVLVTDIGYDSDGNLAYIDITEQTPPQVTRTRYGAGGSYSLSYLTSKYFKNYILYRSKTRTSVTYTHICEVPINDDSCENCELETLATPVLEKASATLASITLKWNALANATGYEIYRNNTKIATVNADATTYTDSKLKAATTYSYKIRSMRNSQTSSFSSVLSCATANLSLKMNLTKSEQGINITWNQLTGIDKYNIYRRTPTGSFKKIATLSDSQTSYLDTDIESNKVYLYYMKAYEDDATVEDLNIWVDTPSITKAKAVTNGISLSWSTITGAGKYYIYRNGKKIAETTTTSYTDNDIAFSTTYKYSVSTVYSWVESGKSTSKSVKSPTLPTLTTPVLKTATSNSKGTTLTWDKVNYATDYYVYRKTLTGSFKKVATVTGTSYTDMKAKNTTPYYYTVQAYATVNGKTTTSSKNETGIFRKAKISVNASNLGDGIELSWAKVSSNITYKIFRRQSTSEKWGSVAYATTTSTSYTDTNAAFGSTYEYGVKAYYGSKLVVDLTYSDFITHKLLTPTIKISVKNKKVTISWDKITGAKGYVLQRKTKGGTWSTISTLSKLTYTDSLSNGAYYYRVRAYCTVNKNKQYSSYNTSSLITIK